MSRYLEFLFGTNKPAMDGHLLRSRPPASLRSVVFIFVLGNLVPVGLMAATTSMGEGSMGLTAIMVLQPLFLLLLIFIADRGTTLPLEPLDTGKVALFAILWPVLLRVVTVVVAALQTPLGLVAEETNNPLMMDLDMAGIERLIMMVAVGLLIPIAEEFFYRDLLYRSLGWLGPGWAATISSLIWALMHGSLPLVLPLFMVGMLLAGLYEITENLGAPILAHIGFNLSSLIMVFLMPIF